MKEKRLNIGITIALVTSLAMPVGSSYALDVDFNNYVSAVNNDYTKYFKEGGAQGKYTVSPTGGLTGGSLIPSEYASYGNDLALFHQNISNTAGSSIQVGTSFLYDSSLVNPFAYNTALQFFLNPLSDLNHYILAGIRGAGSELQFVLSSYSKNSQNDPSHPTFALSSGHWYDLEVSVSNIGGSFGQLEVTGQLFDLGIDGLHIPTLIVTDSLNTYDAVFSREGQIRLGIYSERWGGAAALDNFSVSPVPEPESYAMLLIGLGLISFVAQRRKDSLKDST